MLRTSIKGTDGYHILIGLAEGNILRLQNGQPIHADLQSFGIDLPGSISILYGPSEENIVQNLRDVGVEMPDNQEIQRHGFPLPLTVHDDKLLILCVGLPRAGKTTWAKRQGYPIVSPDAIRLAIHGQRYRQESEHLVWSMPSSRPVTRS